MTAPEDARSIPTVPSDTEAWSRNDGVARRRRRRVSRPVSWRRRIVFGSFVAIVALLVLGGFWAWTRYAPFLDHARDVKAAGQRLVGDVRSLSLAVDRSQLATISGDLDALEVQLQPFRTLLESDPLVQFLRRVPPIAPQVTGAEQVVAAADELVRAARTGLGLGERYVGIRERATGRAGSTMASLVELMATSQTDVSTMAEAVTSAQAHLAAVPSGVDQRISDAATLIGEPLGRYAPLLSSYQALDGVLPGMVGWGAEKRYLVLAQNPAELRPTGGFTGTVGVVSIRDGRITGRQFQDVYNLDLKPGLPYQEPPAPLQGHLLGKYSWQLADANWSPDFPTSAQDALRLYTLESGDAKIDGVIGITTFAIDRLLEVTGPIGVPDYGVTVRAGETTLKSLQLTRAPQAPGEDRKAFLDALASLLVEHLQALPPDRWPALLTALQKVGDERLATVWFRDPAAQAAVRDTTFGGGVRQDTGDYVFAVDANVAPAGKLNLIVKRSQNLDVAIDGFGNARNTLRLSWTNDYDTGVGEPYTSLRKFQTTDTYGTFVRVLAPERSRLESVSGGSFAPVTSPELSETEAGREVFGNFLLIPPGTTNLAYSWTSPYAADQSATEGLYTLTVQKQPGMSAEQFELTIAAPEGSRITDATPGLAVSGNVARVKTSLTGDLVVAIRYQISKP